jgi:hypothetical protein
VVTEVPEGILAEPEAIQAGQAEIVEMQEVPVETPEGLEVETLVAPEEMEAESRTTQTTTYNNHEQHLYIYK